MAKPEKEAESDSRISNGAIAPEEEVSTTTTIVRKKVTVQRWSEPLMNIVDQMPKKNSPPPQSVDQEDLERPRTPRSARWYARGLSDLRFEDLEVLRSSDQGPG